MLGRVQKVGMFNLLLKSHEQNNTRFENKTGLNTWTNMDHNVFCANIYWLETIKIQKTFRNQTNCIDKPIFYFFFKKTNHQYIINVILLKF